MYLRYWAKELQIPILSIDYSLAPTAPYPQAVKEVYYAYLWALNNFDKLGTTGEKVVFSGDSAGKCTYLYIRKRFATATRLFLVETIKY